MSDFPPSYFFKQFVNIRSQLSKKEMERADIIQSPPTIGEDGLTNLDKWFVFLKQLAEYPVPAELISKDKTYEE